LPEEKSTAIFSDHSSGRLVSESEEMLVIGDAAGTISFWAVSYGPSPRARFLGMPKHASMVSLITGAQLLDCQMSAMSRRLLAQNGADVSGVVVIEENPRLLKPMQPRSDSPFEHKSVPTSDPAVRQLSDHPMILPGLYFKAKEQNPPTEHKTSAPVTSIIVPLSQHGLLAHRNTQDSRIAMGQAVLAFVNAIDTQRTVGWDAQAHLSFTATIVSAFAKGQKAFDALCASPTTHSIPVPLGRFIQAYVAQHPELRTLSADPDFANQLKRELIRGNLEALHQRFGLPYLPEPQKSSCAMM